MTTVADTLLVAAAALSLAGSAAAAQDKPQVGRPAPTHAPTAPPRSASGTPAARPDHGYPRAFGGGAHPGDVRLGGPPPSQRAPQPATSPPPPPPPPSGFRHGPAFFHAPEAGGPREWPRPTAQPIRRPTFTYRGVTRPAFRAGGFRWPAGYGYRRYSRGARLPFLFLNPGYAVWDYAALDLAPPPYVAAHWLRYGPDALLVDDRTGEVLDVAYGVFDDGSAAEFADAAPPYGTPSHVAPAYGQPMDDDGAAPGDDGGDDAPY